MKNILSILIVLLIGLNFLACEKDELAVTLNLDEKSLVFDSSEAQEREIGIKTNASSVDIEIPVIDKEWCSAKKQGEKILISVKKNLLFETSRSTKITVTAKGAAPETITVTQQGKKANSEIGITSFLLPAEINNLPNDINGIINHKEQTITFTSNVWIPNAKKLIVNFLAEGKVYVDGKEQISGVTTNSFLEELTYAVKKENGATVNYNIIAKGPMFTGLPVISVDIDGGLEVVEKTKKLPAIFNLSVPGDSQADMSNTTITIRGRGNTSWHNPKKPYRIDFPDKTSLFGLPKAKKWVLLANYQDPTLLMNDIAFELGRRLGVQYTHSSIHVELFLNGKYRGNYQLTEQNEIGEGRVDVDEKGGFLVEMDTHYDEDYKFRTKYLDLPVMVSGPDLNNESEMEYIKEPVQALESSLFEGVFPNNKYEQYTDVNSLINFMLVNEIVGNSEVMHPKSTYFYKDVNSKIMWGPLWDFDWAFGFNEKDQYFLHSILVFFPGNENPRSGSKLFTKFLEDPGFRTKYKERWNEVRPLVVDMLNYIDRLSIKLNKSQTENFNVSTALPITKNASYQELISQMKSWINNRITLLDKELKKF